MTAVKRLGVDCDGVLSNFFKAYEELFIKIAGKDLFPAKWPDVYPVCWEWPQHYRYTNEHASAVWQHIKTSKTFWKDLDPLPGAVEAMKQLQRLAVAGHHVFFISDRTGVNPKRQTEKFLYGKGFVEYPTVILASNKAAVVHALDLDFMIDDKPETITSLCELARNALPKLKGHFYAPDYPYNRAGRHADVVVVKDLAEALKREGLWKE